MPEGVMVLLIYTVKFDRKKAAFWVAVAALLLVGVILMAGAFRKAAAVRNGGGGAGMKTEAGRVAWLRSNGWEVESPAESESRVLIPATFSRVFEEYNSLQKRQGFDLSRYSGKEVTMFTYRVTNAGSRDEEVLAVLYLLDGALVGGDVHSTALNGFMEPLLRPESA